MKITHIVSHFGKNGVTSSCRALITAQMRRGHEILLVGRPGSWLSSQAFPAPFASMETGLATRPAEIRRVGYEIRDWGSDIIHCHGSRANKYGMVFRIAANAAVVTTAHSRHVQIPFAFFKAVIAPSRQTADFHRRYNLVRRSRLHVIPHFVPLAEAAAGDAAPVRAEFGLPEDAFVIGMVGSICRRKNQADGLRILRSLSKRHNNVRLLVVGSLEHAGEMPGWGKLLDDPLIAGRTVLAGHRDDAERLMRACNVLLSTSKQEEGPIAVLEAMAAAVPVVAYRTGQAVVLIRNGIDGYAVGMMDRNAALQALATLIEDPDGARRIGLQGQRRVRELCSEDAIVAQVEKVYETVADGR
ncbi:glycosyltransferase family 4 protein [Nitratireductor sp. XY-223]|uniref:glycosyltransferase family 4 protein n=1 Tax=Nitratireductor sp. XY-223 TaxID=2561926 RepID=UPI00145B612D|nr:glycosyltransferase family 4 protein [Nitratireductor sp. XY-223]